MNFFQSALIKYENKKVFFVVVGAMDGVSHDELYPYAYRNQDWSGLLIEPVPSYFEELKENYNFRDNLIFENVAIADTDELRTIYTVNREAINKSEVPFWCNGISTFNPTGPTISAEGIKDKVVTQQVSCLQFEKLAVKYGIKSIDILQIDAEGHDYIVFNQIWNLGYRPKIIHIEIVQMSRDESQEIIDKLNDANYLTSINGDNLTAVKNASEQTRKIKKRIAFFTENKWAFGAIHTALERELYSYNIDADLIDWQGQYSTEDICELEQVYDLFITSPGYPVTHLIETWNVPVSKIAAIAHGRNEIKEAIDQQNQFDQLAGFACVASSLKKFASELGIDCRSNILRNGIVFDRFYQKPAQRLERLGFAGANGYFDNTNEKDCKRLHLAHAIADNLKLPIIPAYYRHFLRMPQFYSKIDCVIVPSNQDEACGLPLMESAAAGRLPVSAKIGIVAEFENTKGLILPLEAEEFVNRGTEFLYWLMDSPKQFRDMCEDAQEFAYENYDWHNVSKAWADFIFECLGDL